MKQQYILAIDQGTSGTKAVIYDRNGMQVCSAYEELRQYYPKPGWVEHSPEEIWRSVENTIRMVCEKVPAKYIAAIGITNQRETTILWDRKTGAPVYNAIVWQCRRTADRCTELKRHKKNSILITERTGLPIDAYFSATKLEWILQNIQESLRNAEDGKLAFGTSDSWVLWKLTGGAVHSTDYTNASRTMLFNIETRMWDDDLLEMFGIPFHVLPEVKKSSGFFGETADIGILPSGIPISGVAGDQQAALFGHACFDPGESKNTYGTGCFVLMNTGDMRPISQFGLISTLVCNESGGPVFALEGSIFIAGAAVQWLRDGLKILKNAPESEDMAKNVEDTTGVYFVPAFVGLGAPYWDPDARGSIFGITRGTRTQHIVRAALEAMCYQTRDVLEAMRKDTGLKISSLKVDGGAVANNFLCQFQSDILGIEVVRPQEIEITSLGAAYLAGLAVGYWADAQEIKKFRKYDTVFRPAISQKRADDLYAGWNDAVNRTLSRR
jgi:glycerol kinase